MRILCIDDRYLSLYPPAPLGGHQAAKSMLQSACPKSFQSFKSQVDSQVFHSSFQAFKSQVDSQVSIHFQSSSLQLAVCQSGISLKLFAG